MAIIIPSKSIYGEKENPKVLDNLIERIEVGAVEVLSDNDYETPVYNEKFLNNLQTQKEDKTGELGYDYNGVSGARYRSWALISSSQSFFTVDLAIPKVKNNKYISKIFNKKKENGENWIGVNIAYQLKKGNATARVTDIEYEYRAEMASYSLGEIQKQEPTTIEDGVGTIPNADTKYEYTANEAQIGSEATAISTITFVEKSNISTIDYDDTDPNYIKFNGVKILSSSKTTTLDYGVSTNSSDGTPSKITLTGEYIDYEAVSIEITIYGNTIGIDLTDKTVYINGQTSKKVHSVDGNELMQTTNYIEQNGEKINAIEKMYGETQVGYARGKETAKIRCSISDYYDENNNKVISIDKSTGRMSFNEGDKVIPMVYGANGQDKPMSYDSNGNAKVFNVLGVKKYCNGAVWQELSLQEA